jgi:hypothetical protein
MKYRVFLVESERGWGQDYWTEDYNTFEEAKARIKSVNDANVSDTAPDWYMQAEDRVEAVE